MSFFTGKNLPRTLLKGLNCPGEGSHDAEGKLE
jgi:hypothetical protein